jgi:hypothetical protein
LERKKMGDADLVAETGVTAADALFVAWADSETHVSVESRRAALAWCVGPLDVGIGGFGGSRWGWGWRKARRVVVKVEVDGGCAADVGIAAERAVFDGFRVVEREEGEGRARRLFSALHLQDWFYLMAYTCCVNAG